MLSFNAPEHWKKMHGLWFLLLAQSKEMKPQWNSSLVLQHLCCTKARLSSQEELQHQHFSWRSKTTYFHSSTKSHINCDRSKMWCHGLMNKIKHYYYYISVTVTWCSLQSSWDERSPNLNERVILPKPQSDQTRTAVWSPHKKMTCWLSNLIISCLKVREG